MFDFWTIALFFLHGGAAVSLVLWVLRRWSLPVREWPFVAFLLLWTALVLTSQTASALGQLGSLSTYVYLSFGCLGLVLFLFRLSQKVPAAPALVTVAPLAFDEPQNLRVRRFLFWFLGGTLGLFALISFVLAMGVYPDNADSIIYRLARVVWYVSNGSFLHPFDVVDKRLVYYPLSGVALYVPLVLHSLPGTFYSFPSLLSWGLVVYASYRFARDLGGDRLLALLAAWLVGLTPSILAQAISTNDEILAASVLLCGLYMGWRWLISGRAFYFLLMGIAVALSASTKLHIVFLLPVIGLLAAMGLFQLYKDRTLMGRLVQVIGWRTGLMTLFMMAVIFVPFLVYNYLSVGRVYFLDDFKGHVFNLSASLEIGLQNLLIYFSQMIFSPIGDLNFWPDVQVRQRFNHGLNEIFNPLIKPLLNNDASFFHMTYRFVGVVLPVSVRFVEFSLWAAFVWMLWPWQTVLALRQKTPLRSFFFVLALTPFLWLLIWSFSTLYMEGTATYFTFYLVCAAPAAVMVFGKIKQNFYRELRWVVVVFVAATNLIIAHNLVMYSGFRALPDLVYAKKLPYDWLLSDPTIIDEIKKAKRIRIAFTHEKMPYFGYMHWNPRAEYISPYDVKAVRTKEDHARTLQLFPVSSLYAFGFMPVKIPGKRVAGATYLGTVRAIGNEAIFAAGNGVDQRHPKESDYIVFRLKKTLKKKGKGIQIGVDKNAIGFSTHDRLNFEYKIIQGDKLLFRRKRDPDPVFSVPLGPLVSREQPKLTIIVSSSWSGKELTRITYPLGGKGAWLPDRGEY